MKFDVYFDRCEIHLAEKNSKKLPWGVFQYILPCMQISVTTWCSCCTVKMRNKKAQWIYCQSDAFSIENFVKFTGLWFTSEPFFIQNDYSTPATFRRFRAFRNVCSSAMPANEKLTELKYSTYRHALYILSTICNTWLLNMPFCDLKRHLTIMSTFWKVFVLINQFYPVQVCILFSYCKNSILRHHGEIF